MSSKDPIKNKLGEASCSQRVNRYILIHIKELSFVKTTILQKKKMDTQNKPCIYTHFIHSVVVQDFVSGRVCCVNQYHYES